MYKCVAIPLDGSIVAEGILPFILEIAGPLDIEVVLVRVMVPVPPSVIEASRHVEVEDPEKRRAEAEAYLTPIAAELRTKGVEFLGPIRKADWGSSAVFKDSEGNSFLIASP